MAGSRLHLNTGEPRVRQVGSRAKNLNLSSFFAEQLVTKRHSRVSSPEECGQDDCPQNRHHCPRSQGQSQIFAASAMCPGVFRVDPRLPHGRLIKFESQRVEVCDLRYRRVFLIWKSGARNG